MLDAFLTVAYRHEQEKTASQKLAAKLKAFPLEDLIALAQGDPTAKLAYVDSCCDEGPKTWLDKYRGSALFEKAVALEKQLLEADAASDAKRDEERTTDREMEGTRDALRMQKRMLDLDLALEQEGVEDPEAKEEQGAALIEQAQSQEAAAGKGNEPHEKAETAAIQQFRQAQGQEAAAEQAAKPAGTTVEVKSAALLAKFRNVGKTASAVETLIPEARSTRGTVHPERAQGAGAGEYTPTDTAASLQVDKTAGVLEALKTPIAGTKDWFIRTGKSGLSGASAATKAAPAAARRVSSMPPRTSGTFSRGGVVSIGDDELKRLGFGDLAKRASLRKAALSHGRIIDAVKRAPSTKRLEHAFEHGVSALGGAHKGAIIDQADTLAQAAATKLKGGDWQGELRGLDRLRKAASAVSGGKPPIDPHALYQEVLREYPDFAPKGKKKTAGLGGVLQSAKSLIPGAGRRAAAATVAASRAGGNVAGNALHAVTGGKSALGGGIAGIGKAVESASPKALSTSMAGGGAHSISSAAPSIGMRATSGSAVVRGGPLPQPGASPALGSTPIGRQSVRVPPPPPRGAVSMAGKPMAAVGPLPPPNMPPGGGLDWKGMGNKAQQLGTKAMDWARANPTAAMGAVGGTALLGGMAAGHAMSR